MSELENRIAAVDAREPEQATPEDLSAFAAANLEDPTDTITLDQYATNKLAKQNLLLCRSKRE